MKEYHKIQSIYKREQKQPCKFIEGEFSLPEFEYLKDNKWVWTEKVDGTNIRVMWDREKLRFGGKTDNAQMPVFLMERLQQLFPIDKFKSLYPDISMCLYGEGYGAKIQKGGGNYNPDGVDFVLFDVKIEDWWLERHNIEDIASKLGIETVPIVGEGTLDDAIELVRNGFDSTWGDFKAEGLVLRPKVELKNRRGNRIITKLKTKDFLTNNTHKTNE